MSSTTLHLSTRRFMARIVTAIVAVAPGSLSMWLYRHDWVTNGAVMFALGGVSTLWMWVIVRKNDGE